MAAAILHHVAVVVGVVVNLIVVGGVVVVVASFVVGVGVVIERRHPRSMLLAISTMHKKDAWFSSSMHARALFLLLWCSAKWFFGPSELRYDPLFDRRDYKYCFNQSHRALYLAVNNITV